MEGPDLGLLEAGALHGDCFSAEHLQQTQNFLPLEVWAEASTIPGSFPFPVRNAEIGDPRTFTSSYSACPVNGGVDFVVSE